MTDVVRVSSCLREETAEAHRRVERHAFVRALVRGRLTQEAYAGYLAALLPVYEAVEGALAGDARLAGLLRPGWSRVEAIRADLRQLRVGPVREGPTAWSDHVVRLASGPDRVGVVGHAYTRLLGDLSGGRMIGRLLARNHPWIQGALAFYAFDTPGDADAEKAAWRDALDVLALTARERRVVVDEARRAFVFQEGVFEALAHVETREVA